MNRLFSASLLLASARPQAGANLSRYLDTATDILGTAIDEPRNARPAASLPAHDATHTG